MTRHSKSGKTASLFYDKRLESKSRPTSGSILSVSTKKRIKRIPSGGYDG
jgi:hypothetical protein